MLLPRLHPCRCCCCCSSRPAISTPLALSAAATPLQVGGAAVLQWGGGTPADALASLLQPVQRLLDPTLEDHACDQVP